VCVCVCVCAARVTVPIAVSPIYQPVHRRAHEDPAVRRHVVAREPFLREHFPHVIPLAEHFLDDEKLTPQKLVPLLLGYRRDGHHLMANTSKV